MIVRAFFSHVIFSLRSRTAPAGAGLRRTEETRGFQALFPKKYNFLGRGFPRSKRSFRCSQANESAASNSPSKNAWRNALSFRTGTGGTRAGFGNHDNAPTR